MALAEKVPNPEPQYSYARLILGNVNLIAYWDPYPQYLGPGETNTVASVRTDDVDPDILIIEPFTEE